MPAHPHEVKEDPATGRTVAPPPLLVVGHTAHLDQIIRE